MNYPAVTAYTQVWVEKGSHRIKLYYRCNYIINQTPDFWNGAYLKISYYRPNSS